ncbi:cytochrome b5-like [Pectinophora gossypiella]|uniref:cytochrome b5-like n=1 Tax=Pectinophora gossypiella TaxID=13191 RepID=UPI00214EAEB1|nr:cytochrome b5-like [Pectinophora gossypiella]
MNESVRVSGGGSTCGSVPATGFVRARNMTTRTYTRQELEARNHKEDAAFVIDNVVYDVTRFLEEHPGGPEVLLDNAGRDASQCFHDVGHSEDARDWMKKFVVGEVVEADRREVRVREQGWGGGASPLTLAGALAAAGPPLALAVLAWWLHGYLFD